MAKEVYTDSGESPDKPTRVYLREIEIKFKKRRVSDNAPVNEPITDSKQVYGLFQDLESDQKEKMITIHLDSKNKILCFELVALGSPREIYVRPMEAFRSSFSVNAHAVIIIHNHPSGDPTPSDADINLTNRLNRISKDMGLRLYDHLIIGDDTYFSFADEALL